MLNQNASILEHIFPFFNIGVSEFDIQTCHLLMKVHAKRLLDFIVVPHRVDLHT